AFRDTVESLEGELDENFGRVSVDLYSRTQAGQFYSALEKAKSVNELELSLYWEPTSDILNRNRLYDPILDIMRHPSIHSFFDLTPMDLYNRSSLKSRNDNFFNLRRMEIIMCYDVWMKDVLKQEVQSVDNRGLKRLIAMAPNLKGLTLHDSEERFNALYSDIAQYQTYPIDLENLSLRILPPTSESRQSKVVLQDLADLYRVHGRQIETCMFDDKVDDSAVEALAEATRNGSRLKELTLSISKKFSNKRAKDLASIVAHSELRKFMVVVRAADVLVPILESIQWKHLRQLEISLGQGFLAAAMKTMVDGMKISERVELEDFTLHTRDAMSSGDEELLASFLALSSLKQVHLRLAMTLGQARSLIEMADLSRLQRLTLSTEGFDSAKLQIVLDALQNATELQTLCLSEAKITEKQIEQMSARDVTLTAKTPPYSTYWGMNKLIKVIDTSI
ncbi:hypothetical protein BGZ65_000660, partial [Modicella reniformis]